MQLFQSWADIVIMLVLAIAYIATFIAQKNQIRILKETINSHSELTNSQAMHISAYKNLFDIEKFQKLKDMEIGFAVSELNKNKDSLEKENLSLKDKNHNLTIYISVTLWQLYDVIKATKDERTAHFKEQSSYHLSLNTIENVLKGFRVLDGVKESSPDTRN